ncbi:MAG TPA: hypothetical protein VFR67_00250 [Pilimelia sp.]|nr:hypothetical protein [Pilimelia sp.]
MNDHELLERVAAGAPVPPPGYATDILARARRARARRLLTGSGATAGTIAAAVAGLALLAPGVATGPPPDTPPGAVAQTPSRSVPAEAGAYAAAIEALADEVRVSGGRWPVLYVLDHTCANVVTQTAGECAPQPLPAPLRDAIADELAAYAPVEFVADRAAVTDARLEIVNGGALITLGRIDLRGDRADVPLSVQQGGLNGRGLTYQLSRDGQRWRIDGTVGPGWIS